MRNIFIPTPPQKKKKKKKKTHLMCSMLALHVVFRKRVVSPALRFLGLRMISTASSATSLADPPRGEV